MSWFNSQPSSAFFSDTGQELVRARLEAAMAVFRLAAVAHRAWRVRSSVSLEGTVSVAGAENSTPN